jgi:hypothetical protein
MTGTARRSPQATKNPMSDAYAHVPDFAVIQRELQAHLIQLGQSSGQAPPAQIAAPSAIEDFIVQARRTRIYGEVENVDTDTAP